MQWKEREELKKLVTERLVNNGEVCSPDLVAKTMIIEEIAWQDKKKGKLNPVNLVQGLFSKVKDLPKTKVPFIYIKISLDR